MTFDVFAMQLASSYPREAEQVIDELRHRVAGTEWHNTILNVPPAQLLAAPDSLHLRLTAHWHAPC